eukprot:scaffold370_cov176-Amphora_coffeaeformis.AAC.34
MPARVLPRNIIYILVYDYELFVRKNLQKTHYENPATAATSNGQNLQIFQISEWSSVLTSVRCGAAALVFVISPSSRSFSHERAWSTPTTLRDDDAEI